MTHIITLDIANPEAIAQLEAQYNIKFIFVTDVYACPTYELIGTYASLKAFVLNEYASGCPEQDAEELENIQKRT